MPSSTFSYTSRAEHPGLPLILLGHSMGSFAVQQYLFDHRPTSTAWC
jgi:alpha-beta hydrolase superfamily lysophospholipase